MKNEILNIATKTEVTDYPYGRLRTSAFFSIEFNYSKGFRSVFQTINPKNGRLNAEKKSTYNQFMCSYKEAETGHIKFGGHNANSYKGVNEMLKFIFENASALCLTDKMKESVYLTSIAVIRGNAVYSYDIDKDALLKVIDKPVTSLVSAVKGEKVELSDLLIDLDAIEQLKKEYKPVKPV